MILRGPLEAAGLGAWEYVLLGDNAWINMHRTTSRRFGVYGNEAIARTITAS